MILLAGCTLPLGKDSSETGSITYGQKDNSSDLPTLISQLKKSVVHITYTGSTESSSYFDDDFEVIGSGVIYSVNGSDVYVITNRHVVDLNYPEHYGQVNEEEIIVRSFTNDRFMVKDRLVAPGSLDLAILRFSKGTQDIPGVSVSDYLPLVGHEIITIGMPEELDWSVSKGIVSGIRTFKPEGVISGKEYTAIQTDAAINVGNSGGGMFTTEGSLIGINTWKYIGFDVEGLNFAISSIDFSSQKDEFKKLPLVSYWDSLSGIEAGDVEDVGLMHVTYGYSYDSSDVLVVSFNLVDERGRTTDSDGDVRLFIEDELDNVLYNRSFIAKESDFKTKSTYPFYGKKAYTINIPYDEVHKSQTNYADFVVEFSTNESLFSGSDNAYLPNELYESNYSDYTDYDDYDYYDDYYDDYDYYDESGYLSPVEGSAVADGIEVKLNEGGFDTYYYSYDYYLRMDFSNKGSSKKEIDIKSAVLVLDGKQYSADFWYEDDDEVGVVYPSASVEKEIYFYDIEKKGQSATLYLELRVIEGSEVKNVDLKIDFET
jgi:S1-C subfamily serine protease